MSVCVRIKESQYECLHTHIHIYTYTRYLAGEKVVFVFEFAGREEHLDHQIDDDRGHLVVAHKVVAPLEEDEEHHITENRLFVCLKKNTEREKKC